MLLEGNLELEVALKLLGSHLIGGLEVVVIRDVNQIILRVSVLDLVVTWVRLNMGILELCLYCCFQGFKAQWDISHTLDFAQ